MRTIGVVLLGAFFLSSLAMAAPTPEFTCYEAIETYTSGPFQLDMTGTFGVPSVMFQGANSAQQGLYFLLENSTCFSGFPSQPVPDEAQEFYLKETLPGLAPFYLGFQFIPDSDPSCVWSPAPLGDQTYTDAPCLSANNSVGEQAVAEFLAAKIQTAAQRYSLELSQCSSFGNCRPKQDYIDALNTCQSPALQAAVASAIQGLQDLPECGCPATGI
jgi:hypothetical protein